jgi:hypothetical protein
MAYSRKHSYFPHRVKKLTPSDVLLSEQTFSPHPDGGNFLPGDSVDVF